MKKKIFTIKYGILLLLTVSLGLIQGCYYNKHEYLYPPTCDSINVTYGLSVKPILTANCVSCHSGVNAPNGIMLNDYNIVKAVATSGLLLGVITHSPGFAQMPKDAPKLSDCNISIIRRWVNDGAPDN